MDSLYLRFRIFAGLLGVRRSVLIMVLLTSLVAPQKVIASNGKGRNKIDQSPSLPKHLHPWGKRHEQIFRATQRQFAAENQQFLFEEFQLNAEKQQLKLEQEQLHYERLQMQSEVNQMWAEANDDVEQAQLARENAIRSRESAQQKYLEAQEAYRDAQKNLKRSKQYFALAQHSLEEVRYWTRASQQCQRSSFDFFEASYSRCLAFASWQIASAQVEYWVREKDSHQILVDSPNLQSYEESIDYWSGRRSYWESELERQKRLLRLKLLILSSLMLFGVSGLTLLMGPLRGYWDDKQSFHPLEGNLSEFWQQWLTEEQLGDLYERWYEIQQMDLSERSKRLYMGHEMFTMLLSSLRINIDDYFDPDSNMSMYGDSNMSDNSEESDDTSSE